MASAYALINTKANPVLGRQIPCCLGKGIFVEERFEGTERWEIYPAFTMIYEPIPYASEQGIKSAHQGIKSRHQGIYRTDQGMRLHSSPGFPGAEMNLRSAKPLARQLLGTAQRPASAQTAPTALKEHKAVSMRCVDAEARRPALAILTGV
jgi:hypothetical protein